MALETPGCPAVNALPPLASRFLKVDELPWKPTQVEGIEKALLSLLAQKQDLPGKPLAALVGVHEVTLDANRL
ncbi:hypothetical protein AYO32_11315 [Streptococcus pneumoniae]|nr:hypothetical protein AYO32_11315 [Streptococcus pneumoniae]